MSLPPPREKDAKGAEENPQPRDDVSPNDRFRALAGRLLRVPVADIREVEERRGKTPP